MYIIFISFAEFNATKNYPIIYDRCKKNHVICIIDYDNCWILKDLFIRTVSEK